MSPRVAAALVLLMASAGCARAPALDPPTLSPEPPARWSAEPQAASPPGPTPGEPSDAWWEDLGVAGLSEAVEQALAHNYDLAAAAARLEQAAARARIAGAELKPRASINASARRQRQNFIGLPIPGREKEVLSSTATSLGVSLETSWEIDLWGRLRADAGAAIAELQAASVDFAGARLSLAGQTTKAWLSLAEAEQQAALAGATVQSWRASAEQVRQRYDSGLRSSLDVRLAVSNLETAEALRQQRLRRADAAARQLEVLLGRYPGREISADSQLPPVPAPVPVGIPAELVSRRPDLVAAERRLVSARARHASARRALYPRISLTGSGGTASGELKELLDGDFKVWSLLANLSAPLLQGGRLRAGVDQARAAADEALADYASTALGAFAEVEVALASESFLAEREAHLLIASEQAAAARRLAEDRYQSGLEDYVTVLESQRRAFSAESDLLGARLARLTNRVDLHLALGGGFVSPLELGRAESTPSPRASEEGSQ